MRLVGRWLWTLIALSACCACLLLILSHEMSNPGLGHSRSPLRTSQVILQWTHHTSTPGVGTTGTIAASTPAPAEITTEPTTTKPTTAEPTLTKPTTAIPQRQWTEADGRLEYYRKRCWKSGFSPASGKPANYTPEDFIISESRLCIGRLLLLVIVHSEVGARSRRDLARLTWASLSGVNGHRFAVVFIVGASGDAKQQAALREESAEAADLVQTPCRGDDASACKALYSLLWVTRHCGGAEFLLKVDDHVFVNVFHVVALIIERLAGATNTFYCRTAVNEGRITQKGFMWHVTEEEWSEAVYPPHCKGMTYLMSGDLAPRLLQCAAWRNYLHLEDIFLTGVLGQALGARLLHWATGWDADWMHPKHDGPAIASFIVLASPEGAPLPYLHRRVWKAALVYSGDFI